MFRENTALHLVPNKKLSAIWPEQQSVFLSLWVGEDIHKKCFLNELWLDRTYPPFSKMKSKGVLKNQILIDYDDENDDYDDDNGDNSDAFDNDNDQKPCNYHDFVVKIYPF